MPEDRPAEQGEPFLEALNRRVVALRLGYPQIHGMDADVLFLAFLLEASRFGVFEYGPIRINVATVEDRFVRSLAAVAPGEPHRLSSDVRDFYARLSEEVERSGARRANELHYLLAFMRSPQGLATQVFGELGIAPDSVERFARTGPSPGRPDVFLSPEDVAMRLGVNVQTVRAWIRSGKLPASRLAGRRVLRVRESDLDAVLEPVDPADFA